MNDADGDDNERSQQRDLVRRGYDAISAAYRDDEGQANAGLEEGTAKYRGWVGELAGVLPPSARVLDLGCGAGVPTSRLLVERGYRVTGLDISSVQIDRARSLVHGATFLQADLATWECAAASFDAIVSLYTLIHVPLEDQRRVIPRLARWLVPGGYLLVIVGHEQWSGVEDYLGAPMFWDHADTATYLRWLEDAGFAPRWHRFIPEGSSGHTLVLAQAL